MQPDVRLYASHVQYLNNLAEMLRRNSLTMCRGQKRSIVADLVFRNVRRAESYLDGEGYVIDACSEARVEARP